MDVSSRRIAIAFVDRTTTHQILVRCDHGFQLADDLWATQLRLTAELQPFVALYPPACIYVEEPMGRGNKTTLTSYVAITLTSLRAITYAPIDLVRIQTWRKTVLGSGNADKRLASLFASSMRDYKGGDEDLEEAICIACHGLTQEFS